MKAAAAPQSSNVSRDMQKNLYSFKFFSAKIEKIPSPRRKIVSVAFS